MKTPRRLLQFTTVLSSFAVSGLAFAQNVVVLPSPPPATSEDMNSETVELRDAVAAALRTHPSVQQAASLLQQREAEERIVRSDGRPVIEYALQPGFDPESNRDAILQLSVSGRIPVYDFGQLRARRNAAQNRIEQYRHLYANAEEIIAVDLVKEYIQYVLWRDATSAADLQLEQLTMIRGRIEMRIAAGLADVSDLRRTDVSISRANLQRDQVRNQMETAADRIRALANVEGQPVASLESLGLTLRATQILPVDNAGDMPAVAAARSDWEASKQEIAAARAARFPTISVGATNSSYLLNERLGGRSNSSLTNTTRYGVFLTGRIALGGGNRHRVAAAQSASEAAQSNYDTEVLRQDMAIRFLRRQSDEAMNRFDGTGQVITVLEQARDLYWQEYILSKRRLTEVFDVEREIYQSRVDQLQARADQLAAVASQLGIQGQLVSTLQVPSQAGVGQ